jgi:hypothetical protein
MMNDVLLHLLILWLVIGVVLAATVAVSLMLTAVVGVLAGLDAPTEEPFGLDPVALEAERDLIAQDVDIGGQSASESCRSLPVPVAEPRALY